MDPIERQDKLREARRRQRAQRRRAGQLRGRVVVTAVICFALLWGIVFVQMATGNDPVLSAKHSAAGASGGRHRRVATSPSQPEPSADAGSEAAEDAVEAVESTDPEETEAQVAEPEPEPEPEFAEPEPEPLVTSQS